MFDFNYNDSEIENKSHKINYRLGPFSINDNFLQFKNFKIELETLLLLLIGLFLYLEGNNDLILFIILILLILSWSTTIILIVHFF